MKTFFDLRESLVEKSFDHQAAARKHDELAKKVDGKTKNNHVWSAHKDAAKAHKQAHSMMSRGDKPSALAKKKSDAAKFHSQRAMELQKASFSKQEESVDLDENARVKAALRKISGASMMDLERAGNEIRAYAKKSGGADKKDFDTAADYVIALGRLNDPTKATRVKQDLTTHVGLLDTDVRDKIKSMLPKGLKI